MKRFITLMIAVMAAFTASAQLSSKFVTFSMGSSTGVVSQTGYIEFTEPVEIYSYTVYNSGPNTVSSELDIDSMGVITELASAVTNTANSGTNILVTPTATIVSSGVNTNLYATRPIGQRIKITTTRPAFAGAATTNTFIRCRIIGNKIPLQGW